MNLLQEILSNIDSQKQIQNCLLKSIFKLKTLLSDRKDRLIDLITINTNHKVTDITEVSKNHANIEVNQALESSTDSLGVNNLENARMDTEAININKRKKFIETMKAQKFSARYIYENRASIQPFTLVLHYS